MRDAPPNGAAEAQVAFRLDGAHDPQERLSRLLAVANDVLSIDAQRARQLAQEADALAKELDAPVARAEALYLQGRCADVLLQHATALDAFAEALRLFESAQDHVATAKTLRAISFVHDTLGDSACTLDFQFRALELDERTGNESSRAEALRTIGMVHSRSGDPREGLEFYRKSLALCTRPEDAIERAKTLHSIGINLQHLGEFDAAHVALQEALGVFESLGLPQQQAATLNDLALVQQRLGRVAQAERTLRDALGLSEATGSRHGAAHAALSLGKLCMVQERNDEARTWLVAALQACAQLNLKSTQYQCYEALSDLDAKTGDHASALAHYRRFHALEREVLSEDASNQLRAAQIQFQVTAAKQEAELERRRQEVLTRANAELEEVNVSLTEENLQKIMLLDQLERQTHEDALTGLANRRRLDQRLTDEFALAVRHGRPLAVVIADLDHFKSVNDRFSHAVGDAALRAIAKLLTSQVRQTDLVARFGGEEFVLVLVETDAEAALRVCEKLRATVANHTWTSVHPELALTLSLGVCADTSLPSYERMLAVADSNLYSAKAAGRNRVVG